MSELKEKYDKITEERAEIIKEIKELKENEFVKRYLESTKKNNELYDEQTKLWKDLKMEEYKSCEHLTICTRIDYDRYEGRSHKYYGCVKCKLDTSVYDRVQHLTLQEKIMYNYLEESKIYYYRINDNEITCDLDLAHAIYTKIKENNPDIDDKTIVEYLKYALNDIRNTKVSEERKNNRIKRLSLNNGFKNWNVSDVYND